MWHNDKTVSRTHCKHGSKAAWAIISGVTGGWLRIRPTSPDGVTNVFMILTVARANDRRVDVRVVDNEIVEATLR